MKYLLLIFLLVFSLFAEDKKEKITVGVGPYVQTQPYKNVDDLLIISPVIFFDNGIFYVRWSRAGLYFYGEKTENLSWGFSLTLQPRPYGYDSSDIQGMKERKNTWEAGLAFSAQIDKAYIETMLLTDMLNRYDSWIFKTEVGYDFKVQDLSFYPSLILIYQSSSFNNYYYGVRVDEATRDRETYIAQSGLQIGLQTYINYPLTKELSILTNLRVDKLPQEAINSPIVNKNYIYSGLLSLIYTFEY